MNATQGGSGSGIVALRSAGRGDIDAIEAIEKAAFASVYERFGRRQILRMIDNPRAYTAVATLDGRVVGWSGMLTRTVAGVASARLYGIAVHPSAGGRGIGRKLAEDGIRAMRQRGARRIYLEVRTDNTPAIGLYRSLGFVEVERLPGYYTTADGVRMRLELDAVSP